MTENIMFDKEFFINSNGYQMRKCGYTWDYCDGNCTNCEKTKVSYITTDCIKGNYYPSTTNHTTYNKPFSMISEDAYTGAYLESDEFGTRICNGKSVYCDGNCDKCTIDFN